MNREKPSLKGPVVVGGVGGSGTRVVAEILMKFGYFMGRDLNASLDNLSFTLLFKRRKWLTRNYTRIDKIRTGFRILDKTLHTGQPLTLRERCFARRAAREISRYGHNMDGAGKGQWPYDRLEHVLHHMGHDRSAYPGWGWKEPNSHLLLPSLNDYFTGLRYIHLVRHGLDMAYSRNQQQLFNWGPLFGIRLPETTEETPLTSFRFWVMANRQALETGRIMGDKKFLMLKFEDLCDDPEAGIRRISDFLEIQPSQELLAQAAALLQKPQSVGRYKHFPVDGFQQHDLEFLQSLGYETE